MVTTPAWLIYERCVAAFIHEAYGDLNTIVQPNVMLKGVITGIVRQVDVLIDARWGTGTHKRIIIDAKYRRQKISVSDVESFEGMMKDCAASYGILECTSGYTAAGL